MKIALNFPLYGAPLTYSEYIIIIQFVVIPVSRKWITYISVWGIIRTRLDIHQLRVCCTTSSCLCQSGKKQCTHLDFLTRDFTCHFFPPVPRNRHTPRLWLKCKWISEVRVLLEGEMTTRWATSSACYLAPSLLCLPLSSKFYNHMVHNTYVMKWALSFHMEVFSLWYTPCSFLLADFHACCCLCLSFLYAFQLSWFARLS